VANGIATFYATRFVRAARHVACVTVRMHARTHARTYARPAAYAGAARYGRKSFIYSFTAGPKKRGKYRPKEDL